MRSLVLLAAALWAVGEAQSVLESRPLSSSRKFFKALSPRKRSSLAASSGCPSIGQPCATVCRAEVVNAEYSILPSTPPTVQFPEEAFNCVFTTAAPSYCNITNTTADVATGTCTAPTAAKYISNVFGKSCTTLDDCEAFELEPSFYGERSVKAGSVRSSVLLARHTLPARLQTRRCAAINSTATTLLPPARARSRPSLSVTRARLTPTARSAASPRDATSRRTRVRPLPPRPSPRSARSGAAVPTGTSATRRRSHIRAT